MSEFWRSPILDDDASLAAFVDGRLAAITMIRVDRASGRAQNNLAGTLREFRGRGLATLLKSHSLRRAADLGATIAITDNEEQNAPMLAVNTKLGYRPFGRRLTWERPRVARTLVDTLDGMAFPQPASDHRDGRRIHGEPEDPLGQACLQHLAQDGSHDCTVGHPQRPCRSDAWLEQPAIAGA